MHLHVADLDTGDPWLESLGVLSPDERRSADRLRFDQDRRRFAAGRTFLRTVLSRYVIERADKLRFSYGAKGKPELVSAAPTVRFNLSHSGNWAVLGVALHDIGVDVERVHAVPEIEDIARAFFSASEAAAVLAADAGERTALFYRCWTRKEAVQKALGLGLDASMRHVEIGADWSLLAPELGNDLIVAVAVRKPNARIRISQFEQTDVA